MSAEMCRPPLPKAREASDETIVDAAPPIDLRDSARPEQARALEYLDFLTGYYAHPETSLRDSAQIYGPPGLAEDHQWREGVDQLLREAKATIYEDEGYEALVANSHGAQLIEALITNKKADSEARKVAQQLADLLAHHISTSGYLARYERWEVITQKAVGNLKGS